MKIGIDLGGTNLRVGLVDDAGRVVERREMPTPARSSAEFVVAEMAKIVGSLDRAESIGVGAPGLIDTVEGVVRTSPNLAAWTNVPLAALLSEKTGLPVKVANDVNAIAWGEFRFGAGKGCRDILCITLGTGLGGALILDGRLHLGKDQAAGEIGHFTLIPDGYPCPCGNSGCLEQYVAKTGIIRRALQLRPDLENPTPETVAKAAAAGEDWARSVYEGVGINLGQILAGMVQVLNIEKILVGGQISNAGDVLFNPLRVHTAEHVYPYLRSSYRIEKVALGVDSGIIGAAFLE
jgi:glucokinase